MLTRYRFRIRSRRKKRAAPNRRDYLARREEARYFAVGRLEYFRSEYAKIDQALADILVHRKLTIRNTRSRWGSCSSKKNLNFNYRILDLSPEMRDYVIVHELCHLKELHHGRSFWDMMERMIPNARELHRKARTTRIVSGVNSSFTR